MPQPPRIAGAVLAGGHSRRMGRDKALVEVGGRPMLALVVDALEAAGVVPVVVIGGPVGGRPSIAVDQVPDRFPGEGPLGGVVTALDHFGAAADVAGGTVEGVTVVACDLPYLDATVLAPLIQCAAGAFTRATPMGDDVGTEVVVARAGRLHPACAVWSVAAAGRVAERFEAGERSLRRAIATLAHSVVDVPADPLRNINAPADLPR